MIQWMIVSFSRDSVVPLHEKLVELSHFCGLYFNLSITLLPFSTDIYIYQCYVMHMGGNISSGAQKFIENLKICAGLD